MGTATEAGAGATTANTRQRAWQGTTTDCTGAAWRKGGVDNRSALREWELPYQGPIVTETPSSIVYTQGAEGYRSGGRALKNSCKWARRLAVEDNATSPHCCPSKKAKRRSAAYRR